MAFYEQSSVLTPFELKHILPDDKKMLTRGLESPPSPRSPVRCCGGNVIKWDGLINTECAFCTDIPFPKIGLKDMKGS